MAAAQPEYAVSKEVKPDGKTEELLDRVGGWCKMRKGEEKFEQRKIEEKFEEKFELQSRVQAWIAGRDAEEKAKWKLENPEMVEDEEMKDALLEEIEEKKEGEEGADVGKKEQTEAAEEKAESKKTKQEDNVAAGDYYKVLGVARNSSKSEINTAYKKLALKCHPDKNQANKAQAEEDFKKIKEAHSILSDDEKRKMYDHFGKDGMPGHMPGGMPGGMSSGMSSEQADALFQAFFGRGHTHNEPAQRLPVSVFMPVSTAVVIRGLTSHRFNGRTGRVTGLMRSTVADDVGRRYQVAMDDDGSILALRHSNLTQLCPFEVIGLESKPELNGMMGDIFNYDAESGRYMVSLQEQEEDMVLLHKMPLPRRNCLLKEGTRVALEGLCSHETHRGEHDLFSLLFSPPQLNGQSAQIVAVDRSNAQYTVMFQNGEQIKVKYDNVLC